MVLRFSLDRLPRVCKFSCVTRKTVWRIAETMHVLIFIVSGSCTITINRETELMEPGDAIWIPAGTPYERHPFGDGMCTMYYLFFTTSPVDQIPLREAKEALASLAGEAEKSVISSVTGESWEPLESGDETQLFTLRKVSFREKAEPVTAILRRAGACVRMDIATARVWRNMQLARILLLMSEASVPLILADDLPVHQKIPPTKLAQAIWFIRQHYMDKISLSDVCAYCSVSRQQMIRYFRDGVGMTPNAYITQYKMDKARERIAASEMTTVKEVAQELGFDDQGYFSRVFSRTVGESPSAYRTRVTRFDEKKHIAEAMKQMDASSGPDASGVDEKK